MADLRKYEVCECIRRPPTGILAPQYSEKNIVLFNDKFRMIDTIIYVDGNRKGRKREFLLDEKEYFKRKLDGS